MDGSEASFSKGTRSPEFREASFKTAGLRQHPTSEVDVSTDRKLVKAMVGSAGNPYYNYGYFVLRDGFQPPEFVESDRQKFYRLLDSAESQGLGHYAPGKLKYADYLYNGRYNLGLAHQDEYIISGFIQAGMRIGISDDRIVELLEQLDSRLPMYYPAVLLGGGKLRENSTDSTKHKETQADYSYPGFYDRRA